MTLVDSSVWMNHFRLNNPTLDALLASKSVAVHPFSVGEIACGDFRNRTTTLKSLSRLPQAPVAAQDDVMTLIEEKRLWGKGLSWIDVHILAPAATAGWAVMMADRRMRAAAFSLSIDVTEA